MAKAKEFLGRFGANLAESMGAGRAPGTSPPPAPGPAGPSRHDGVTRLRAAAEIEVDRIAPDPNQPRAEFDDDAIDRLAASLSSHGLIQPISVRWSDEMGKYLIVAGERRWRAAGRAGRRTIAAVVLEGEPSASRILELQLVENALREDLKPVEQARAFRTLMESNGWTGARLAGALNLNAASVSRSLALLELPCTVQASVERGELPASVAYEVSKLGDPADQAEVAARVVAEGLNRAEVARAVKSRTSPSKKGRGGRPAKVTERSFKTAAGPKVTVEFRRGLDPGLIRAALLQAVGTLDAEADQAEAAA
jgi:ParB family chromosome partitioning protein